MKRTPLSPAWQALIDALRDDAAKVKCSPIIYIRETIKISQSSFQRAARGRAAFTPEQRSRLEILCELCDVDSPIEGLAPPPANLADLRMLGEALERGLPPARRTVERLRKQYPQNYLIRLAESDGAPTAVLRAVQCLLEE